MPTIIAFHRLNFKGCEMEVILEHFKMISSIPRCSHHADKMKEYIKEFAKSCDFEVSEDEAGNI